MSVGPCSTSAAQQSNFLSPLETIQTWEARVDKLHWNQFWFNSTLTIKYPLTVWKILGRPLSKCHPICCWHCHVSPPRPRVWAAWCRAGAARGCWGCRGGRGTCHCTCIPPCRAGCHSASVSASWPASLSSPASCAPCSPASWTPAPPQGVSSPVPVSSWLSLSLCHPLRVFTRQVSAQYWLSAPTPVLTSPYWPALPQGLAAINRLLSPLTARAGPLLIRGADWSVEINTSCDWLRGQLPCDQLTGMRGTSEWRVNYGQRRLSGRCHVVYKIIFWNEWVLVKEDWTDRKCAWSHQQIHIRSGR